MKTGKSMDDVGTEDLPWTDVLVFAKLVQQESDSLLGRELNGAIWSIEAQLMAEAVDVLAMANWQRGGRRSAPRPKPIPRPWLKAKNTTLGSDPIPISQFNDWWDKPRAK